MDWGHAIHAICHESQKNPAVAAGAAVGTVVAAVTGVALAPLLLGGALAGFAIKEVVKKTNK
jgi:hypothetical protein